MRKKNLVRYLAAAAAVFLMAQGFPVSAAGAEAEYYPEETAIETEETPESEPTAGFEPAETDDEAGQNTAETAEAADVRQHAGYGGRPDHGFYAGNKRITGFNIYAGICICPGTVIFAHTRLLLFVG